MSTQPADKEKELLLQVSKGDEIAFRAFYDQYHQLLATYIFRLTRSMPETEEIVHDVFLKLWMARDTLATVDNAKAYLFVLSRNHALNVIKRKMRELMKVRQFQQEHPDAGTTAEQADDLHSLLDQAIDRLPEQQKKVFLLSRHERLTYQQIAEQMGLSRETVKTYLQHATSSITRFMKEHTELSLLILIFCTR